MKDLNFEVKNNTVVVHLGKDQMNFCIIVKLEDDTVTERYMPIISVPNSATEIKILDLAWKNSPKPGEEYKIVGCAQDSKTQQWGDWSVQRWTAPGKKQQIVLRIKKLTTPVAEPPQTVPDPSIPSASPDPDPILNQSPTTDEQSNSVISKIDERLNVINTDLDDILEIFRIKAVPNQNQKYLLRVEKTLGSIFMAMEEIAVQVREGLKTSPNYKQVSEKFEVSRKKAEEASKLLKRAQDLLARKYPTQQQSAQAQVVSASAPATTKTPTNVTPNVAATTPVVAPNMTTPPAPTTAAPVDLDPINDRINSLEQQLRDVNDQLADKANSDDLTALSGSVNSLGAQVTGLEGQVSGLETAIENAGETSNNRLDQLTAAIGTLTANVAALTTNTTPAATATTPASTPVATATPAVATAPAMTATPAVTVAPVAVSATPTTTATPANVTATTPVVAPAPTTTNRGGKNKKSGRESVNFFALVLGIVLGVLALIAMFFYATRSQNISAERIGTSDTKSAALAEIENARRLQVEMMDKMHNLQQNVEGYRRQTFVTPSEPAPAKNNAVTNTSTTNNVVAVTDVTHITYSVPSDVSDPRPPMIQRGSYVDGFWWPSLAQDWYSYNNHRSVQHRNEYPKPGFNGYIYPQ